MESCLGLGEGGGLVTGNGWRAVWGWGREGVWGERGGETGWRAPAKLGREGDFVGGIVAAEKCMA
jgi:hypothetical protein